MSVGRFAERTQRRSVSRSRSRERTKALPNDEKTQNKKDMVRKKYLISVSHSEEKPRERKNSKVDEKNDRLNKNDTSNMRKQDERAIPPSKIFIIYFI